MDDANMLFLVFGRCVDACLLLLDLVAGTLGLLLRLLSGAAACVHGSLVALSGSECWNLALFSFLSATEAVSSAACGVLQRLDGGLQALGGVFEGFKMVGHLLCHVTWRVKEALHRGLVSGGCVLRQTCDGVCVLLSLVLYLVNSAVNVALVAAQRCVSVLAGAAAAAAEPLHGAVELALTLLTFLYSCLVGCSVLLWTSCQLLLDSLGACGRVLVTVFPAGRHSLLAAAAFVLATSLVLSPRLRGLAARPGLRFVHRLYAVMLVFPGLHTRTVRGGGGPSPQTDAGSAAETELAPPDALQRRTAGAAQPDAAPGDGELLSLLKEQEERKKCVVCQDLAKTVLLLPCRHLCLCRLCADILTRRRPVQQRCCPLCRQHITQTMDVFL